MGLIQRFIKWVKNIFADKARIEQDLNITMAITDEELRQKRYYRDIYNGVAEWNNDKVPSLKVAKGFVTDIVNRTLVEFEADIYEDYEDNYNLDEKGKLDYQNRRIKKRNDFSSFLNEQFQKYLNDAESGLRKTAINLLADGETVLRINVENSNIYVDAHDVFSYFPLKYNSRGELTSVLFKSKFYRGFKTIKKWYTLLEIRDFDEQAEIMTFNYLGYVSEDESELGKPIALTDVPEWAHLNSEYSFACPVPLFVHIKLMDGEPLFVNAIENLKQLDEQYARVLWEYSGGELAIEIDEDYLKPIYDANGEFVKLSVPMSKERLYRAHSSLSKDDPLFKEWNPALRDENYWRGIDEIMKIVEYNLTSSRGTLSDVQQKALTATEIKMTSQKDFVIVSITQDLLEAALNKLMKVLESTARIYELSSDVNSECNLNVTWGDGVKEDDDTVFKRMLAMTSSGMIDPVYVVSWALGVSQNEAYYMMNEVDEIALVNES